MKKTVALYAAVIALNVSLLSAYAQQGAPKKESLDRFLNMDAKELETKVEVIRHELYGVVVSNHLIRFVQQYGDRVNVENVDFPSGEELIPGYVFTPKNMVKAKKYPAIVWVHGGFHDHFDRYFFKVFDEAIRRGFVVIFPEYRGSAGYGEPHYRNNYGTWDTDDTLASADFVGKLPYVDADRLGIVGHSRGGMVTLLAIQRAPKKFKAAVKIAGLVDFIAYMGYKPEYRRLEIAGEPQFGGKLPHQAMSAYLKISPINFVDKIQTPLYVIANEVDRSVPYELHAKRLIEVLRGYNKTHETLIYKDAPGGHMFPFADTDDARDMTKRTFDFLAKYLKP